MSAAMRAGLAVLAAFALWRAWSLAWLCDDAFISIRYAQNLADGLGLVYNAGERVEGYTNLLWTLLLALAAWAGVSPVAAATWLGLPCYAALAWVLVWQARRFAVATHTAVLPLAAGLVLVSHDFHVWAGGGLETLLFTYLATHALLLTRGSAANPPRSALSGALLAALVLTRPDGLLLAFAGALSYWLPASPLAAGERRRHALRTLLPVAAVLLVGIPAKLAYYGELLPTAFYSKSVLHPYVSQGLVYLGLYLLKNWYLPLAIVAVWIARRRGGSGGAARDAAGRDALFFGGTAALFVAYVVEVGGDFMFARRLVPAAPLVFLAIERALVGVEPARARWLAAATLAGACLPLSPYGEGTEAGIAGIFEERRSYPPAKLAARARQGEAARQALAGLPVRAAFEGGMCVFGYHSELPYLVEATGLTQYSLAKRPLGERGPIGHEKAPDAAWFEANRIHLLFLRDLPPLAPPVGGGAIDEIRFGDVLRARILRYSDAVMDPLRDRPDVAFVPIETVIARAAAQIERAPLAAAERIYDQLDRYYFRGAGAAAEPAAAELRALLERKRAGESAPPPPAS